MTDTFDPGEEPTPKAKEVCPGCKRLQVLERCGNSWPITMLCYDCACEWLIKRSHERNKENR
jgi:hypothetical protein